MKKTSHSRATFRGKVIVILGGVGLLGKAFSEDCARAGARVVIADIDEKRGRSLVRSINEKKYMRSAIFMHVDIGKDTSLRRLVTNIHKHFKHIDGLVHAAYPRTKNYGKGVETAAPRDILKNIELQLGGPLISTRAFLPLLKRGGSIVFLSSIYGVVAPRFEIYRGTSMTVPAEYAAAKGGIIALSRYFAAYLKKRGIRVNVVSPGGIAAGQSAAFVRAYTKYGRLLSPEDISKVVLPLLSSSSKKTGENIIVDDGWTTRV